MMITKRIMIEFADTSIRAIDYIQDIRKAAESAGLNLYSRYDVQLQYPMPTENDRVVVDIKIPERAIDNFSIGNHLRGISMYLLSNYEERYRKHIVGKRLLNYIEVQEEQIRNSEISMYDRLEAIITLTKLLERSDPEAIDITERIMVILNEAKRMWEV